MSNTDEPAVPADIPPASPLPGEDVADIDGPDETDLPQTPVILADSSE